MSEVVSHDLEIEDEDDSRSLEDQILTGIAWALAGFTLGLSVVVLIMSDEPMRPIEALVEWLGG